MIKIIIGLLASSLTYQKSLKDVYTSKFLTFLIPFCQNLNAVSGKGRGAQHCLITLLDKWRESIDRGLEFDILLTDLSKAFDSSTRFVHC